MKSNAELRRQDAGAPAGRMPAVRKHGALAGRMPAVLKLAAAATLLLLAAGCATVQPWDRDLLAQKKMSFNPNPQLQAVDDHIYFSKEGSMGGIGVGGGGCGCN